MASLIEELISTLEQEKLIYDDLLVVANNKTNVIIKGDVSSLQELTESEQELAGRVLRLDKKRVEIISDVALVTNKDSKTLTISTLTQLLENQKAEHDKLQNLSYEINGVIMKLKEVNEQNRILIQQSLDFIEFTVNAIQSKISVPVNINYQSKGKLYGNTQGNSFFDTKQ